MYYLIIILSVIMFGGCFYLNEVYSKKCGSSLKASLRFCFVSSVSGLLVLLVFNGFKFEFTLFTLLMALLSALVSFGFTFCGFCALKSINLSVYSVFSMLGGMLLPFLQGILFYKEDITFAKILCVILVGVSLLFTLKKDDGKKGYIFYIGIFVLNGMSGVLSKIFTEAPFQKTSAAGYSILICVCTAVISGILLLPDIKKPDFSGTGVAIIGGSLSKVANFLLVLALLHVDASVQYPLVTGGVMIVSTLICFFGKNKPAKRELISVAVAFVGMLALFI